MSALFSSTPYTAQEIITEQWRLFHKQLNEAEYNLGQYEAALARSRDPVNSEKWQRAIDRTKVAIADLKVKIAGCHINTEVL